MEREGLTILLDRAACGKSTYLMQQIRLRGLHARQMLMVPEHASHQAERDLCAFCGDDASRYVSVCSFRRLAEDVLSVTGGLCGTMLDSGGKILTMYRALQKNLEVLKVYRRPSQKAAFLEQLIHLDDELRSYGVGAERLLEQRDAVSLPLSEKLEDIALICGTYEAMLVEGGEDRRDRTDRMIEALDTPRGQTFFNGMDLYLDGFMYFNRREEEALRRMMRTAHSVTVSLLGDRESVSGIFETAQRVRGHLIDIARQEGVPATTVSCPAREHDPMDPALRHVERSFFGVLRPYEGDTQAIHLCPAKTQYEEVEMAAAKIRGLLAQGKCRCRDILVAARNMPDYEASIENVFERYAIPVFLNRRGEILDRPVLTMLLAALETISGGFAYEDLFRYLKSGMAGIDHDACDALENYVLKWNIRGRMWTQDAPWTMHPEGYGMDWTDEVTAALEEMNAIRAAVRTPLMQLKEDVAGHATARGAVSATYAFLMQIELPRQLAEKTAAFRAAGENQLADEYAQLWKILCDVMDQFVYILDETEMDIEEFARLFRLVLTQYDVGTIPAALDQVSVSEITRNDRHNVRYVFLLGANDHVLPAAGTPGGILTDSDREELLQQAVELAPFGMDQMNMELLNLYAALAQGTDGLYVSWAQGDGAGVEYRPAFAVRRIQRLFPTLKEEPMSRRQRLCAPVPALEAAGNEIGGALWQYFAEKEPGRLAAMKNASEMKRGRLSPDAVQVLYGKQIRMSASRMDKVNSCHFAYFMQYGLKARERRAAGLDAPEIGTFLHYLLEHTAAEAKALGGFGCISQQELHGIVERYMEKFVREDLGGLENKSARFRYLFSRLRKTAFTIIDNVAAELAASDFEPLAFELDFREKGTIPAVSIHTTDADMTVNGKVDRVDGWIRDGKLYLRVVDYKTGKKQFDMAEILKGVGMQMLLYLFTLEKEGMAALAGENVHEIVPAGVEYLPARDVILSLGRNTPPDKIAHEMEKELRRSGLFLSEPEVLNAMEHGCTEEPHFLPLSIRKDGTIADGVATAQQMGQLAQYVDHLLEEIAKELGHGNIDADPNYRSAANNACTYCEFASACHFSEGYGGDHKNYVVPVKPADFWQQIALKQGERGE